MARRRVPMLGKDLSFLNWHHNRGRANVITGSPEELRKYLRQISHRRAL